MRSLRAFILMLLLAVPLQAAERPNIVLIMSDDQGYGDVGYHGSPYKTPHIDALAKSGVRLEAHYVFPMCSPTRAALLSGRYASRFGCTAATNNQVFPFGTTTLATLMKSAGYATALTGKWHLGSKPEQGPQKFGFDYSYGSLAGGVGPYDHSYKTGQFSKTWHRNGELITEEGHVTDLITDEAIKFIKKDHGKPFFLYVPYTAIHIPIDEPKDYLEANKNIEGDGSRLRAASATHMDAGIGRILAALDDKKVRENTLVIFLSDNGAHKTLRNDDPQYPGKYPSLQVGGSNGKLRGFKTQVYEGGIRTPAIVNWPGRLNPGEIDEPCSVTDWMPTLTALVGVQPRDDLKWDGRDIWKVITRKLKPEARTLYWLGTGRNTQAVRHGDWKLIVPKKGEVELYNLANDLAETKNLAADQPKIVEEMQKRLKEAAERDDDSTVKGQ